MKHKITIVSGITLLAGVIVVGLAHYSPVNLSLPQAPPHVADEHATGQEPANQPAGSQSPSQTSSAVAATSDSSLPKQTLAKAKIVEEPAGDGKVILANGHRYPLRVYKPLAIPNDPGASQWWVQGTGLDTAWEYGAGSYTTTVAVIDTGFALQHEEFTNRWHLNAAEQGSVANEAASQLNCTDAGTPLNQSCNNIDDDYDGIVDNETGATTFENPSRLNCTDQGVALDKNCNRIDDDSNGLIDDVTGWDFSNYDNNVQAGEIDPAGDNTSHGTMVTGVLAATGNNNAGIAGVNWSTKVLPLQALDDNGYGNTLTVARSLRYAADQNADVINISLGTDFEDPYLREAIDYALDAGSLVVAASGNDDCNCISYPAKYPEVVAVGASTPAGNPASFNSYGTDLDLLAPGQDMTVPTWTAGSPTSNYASGVAGTSFASPYVSGLIALAKSHQPDASWGELLATLLEKSDRKTLTANAPHSSTIGYGYAKANTLMARVTTPTVPLMRYQLGPITPVDALDTFRAYQCETTIPATPLYELTRSDLIRYTTSKLTLHRAQQAGWTKTREFHVCIGLPNDSPTTLREINLLGEIKNNTYKQWRP